jgi:hypothetical protein
VNGYAVIFKLAGQVKPEGDTGPDLIGAQPIQDDAIIQAILEDHLRGRPV